MHRKEILVNTLLATVSILIFLAALEVVLRLIDMQAGATPWCGYTEARITSYRLLPNTEEKYSIAEYEMTIKTNSNGFRDDELASDYYFRIVGVGDSFTFGHGVENKEAYLNVVERELNGVFDERIELVNAGIGGFNSIDAFNYVKELEEEMDYNLLVFAVFLGNDVVDNLTENPRRARDDGCLIRLDKQKKEPTLRELLYQNFYVVRFFSNARQLPVVNNFIVAIGLGSRGENNPNFNLLLREQDEKSIEALNKTKQIIGSAQEYLKSNGREMVVLIIPSEYQTYDSVLFADAEKYMVKKDELDQMTVNKSLKSFFESEAIKYVDSTSALREYARENNGILLYFEKDGHLTPLGHEIIGKELSKALEREIS